MSRSAARRIDAHYLSLQTETPEPVERFLPLQLAQTAEVTGRLVYGGLAVRGVTGEAAESVLTDDAGALRPEIAPLARAYEDALLAGLSPTDVRTLRRLLSRVELAAQRLAGER